MAGFKYLGQSYEVIDLNVATSKGNRSYKEQRSFAERAECELSTLTAEEKSKRFISVYSDSGYTYHTTTGKRLFKLALAGQDYIYSSCIMRITYCSILNTYLVKNGKNLLLWSSNRFVPDMRPSFLNPDKIKNKLKSVFKKIEITLGKLTLGTTPSAIAWKISTEEGIFYVPWHNGTIIEHSENFEFEEKKFSEIKHTYKVLRFVQKHDVHGHAVYTILCA